MRFKLRAGVHYSEALGGYTPISEPGCTALQSKHPDSIGIVIH